MFEKFLAQAFEPCAKITLDKDYNVWIEIVWKKYWLTFAWCLDFIIVNLDIFPL